MITGLFTLWWNHVRECRARAAKDAVMRADLDRVMRDIGDAEHGLRGALHKLRDDLSPFAVWVQIEMGKRGER